MKDLYLAATVRVVVPDSEVADYDRIRAYVTARCANATLTSTARHFGFHPNTLAAMVKRATGKTFSQILREVRMEQAEELLADGSIPVAQVAELCGYENPGAFYRAFKDEYGETPRAHARRA